MASRTIGNLASSLLYRRLLFSSSMTKLICRLKSPNTGRKQSTQNVETPRNKVTVVGCGEVGMACAFSILSMTIVKEMALVDVAEKKVKGEMLDLQHGSVFLGNARIEASTDYKVTANSKICVVTAGVRQKQGETRLDLVQRNADLYKKIIPELVKYSPQSILLIVSNPVDVLTYVVWKISGFPVNRVIGSGTSLDSSRFRVLLAEQLRVAPISVHGWVIGEHGDTSVPVWSNVSVAGVCLRDLNPNLGGPNDPEHWSEIHKDVVDSAYAIQQRKGYTSWAIGLSVTSITKALLRNKNKVYALTTNIKGYNGIKEEVYLSLPCIVGTHGVEKIIELNLTDYEKDLLHKSAKHVYDVQRGVKI